MKKIINTLTGNRTMKQFIKFCFVGLSNTFISLVIYYILIYFNIHYLIANLMGFIISVLNSFILNNRFVFNEKKKEKFLIRLLKVYLSYGMTFVLGTLLLTFQVDIIGISKKIAPLINLIITIPINFVLNKKWAFK